MQLNLDSTLVQPMCHEVLAVDLPAVVRVTNAEALGLEPAGEPVAAAGDDD